MQKTLAERYRLEAEAAEAAAEAISDPSLKEQYRTLAERWRALAEDSEKRERPG